MGQRFDHENDDKDDDDGDDDDDDDDNDEDDDDDFFSREAKFHRFVIVTTLVDIPKREMKSREPNSKIVSHRENPRNVSGETRENEAKRRGN